ncbi:hypothetical protein [Kriegella aquimaris]|uniref:Uncharacterized protein n=1 Tax=Kriegella aquimaris TaxID=192904 RepID=A0A1G9V370_9FLAO|nr:hypothetical protein [Kriegella aquimaris]SDM66285.1 hypothetical protein SAMN04488514_11283 [Kriegella aquimaris]
MEIDYNLIIGAIAVIISLIALLYTKSSIKLQKLHNEKSLKPLPMIETGDYEIDIYIKFINKGNGPLIINSIEFISGNKKSESIVNLMNDDLKFEYWNTFYVRNNKEILQSTDEITLLQKKLKSGVSASEKEFLFNLRTFLSQVSVIVEFEDIYNNKSIFKESLNRFSRRLKDKTAISRVDEVGIREK